MSNITLLLESVERGEDKAAEELLPLVYQELRLLASWRMAQQAPGQTLQATALVHEAYLKLVHSPSSEDRHWNGRRHFFAAAAEAMRRILIDRARRRKAAKHGGGQNPIPLEGIELPVEAQGDEETLLAVNVALDRLEKEDPIRAKVVKLRFFVGLQYEEIAEILDVSTRTVKRYWVTARTWLFEHLHD